MLTVAFASFNGLDSLPLMLDALTRVRPPKGGWRLIAVDNASTDGTYELLLSYRDRLPLTVLQQPAQGKSKALNLALQHVEGDLLVLTDDDVIPNPDWLGGWREYVDAHPEYGVFGGVLEPHWVHPPPEWVLNAIPLGLAFSKTRPDMKEGEMTPRHVGGGNMAIRIEAIKQGLRFEEGAGPNGNKYAMGEDTRFAFAAHSLGFHAAHCPHAIVKHIIFPSQYEKSWLLNRSYRYGQSRAAKDAFAKQDKETSRYFQMPRWMLREYLKQRLLSVTGLLSGNKAKHMAAAWEAHYLAGYLNEYRRQRQYMNKQAG
ncbi:MAG: glycosyltransferase family 2 protein [Thiobacillus sp.]